MSTSRAAAMLRTVERHRDRLDLVVRTFMALVVLGVSLLLWAAAMVFGNGADQIPVTAVDHVLWHGLPTVATLLALVAAGELLRDRRASATRIQLAAVLFDLGFFLLLSGLTG